MAVCASAHFTDSFPVTVDHLGMNHLRLRVSYQQGNQSFREPTVSFSFDACLLADEVAIAFIAFANRERPVSENGFWTGGGNLEMGHAVYGPVYQWIANVVEMPLFLDV